MKKFGIILLALIILCGYAIADRGIDPVPETQGIGTSTTIDAVGNFASATELQWRITDDPFGLPTVPPLFEFSGIYESVYTEDTQNHGTGIIAYDKELDVETSGQISGQWNIEATKELAFVGISGAERVVSSDYIMVDGASQWTFTIEEMICPFAPDMAFIFPAYCNRAEAGSTIDMTVANVRTTSNDRFVMPSADHPVELNHDIRVSELTTGVSSEGMAEAYMDVLIQEGRGYTFVANSGNDLLQQRYGSDPLMERIEFHESTIVDGDITLFEKLMHYESMFTGEGQEVEAIPLIPVNT